MQTPGVNVDGPSHWVLAIDIGDLDGFSCYFEHLERDPVSEISFSLKKKKTEKGTRVGGESMGGNNEGRKKKRTFEI